MQELHSQACCRLEQRQPQEVCAVALMIQSLDDNDVVSFFKCTLNVRLLSRMTLRR